jgi:2C-methyl-D-erythritol 2,4-cyclodiphosphate synthase
MTLVYVARGVDSSVFIEEAWRLMDERGYQIGNLDITLVLQASYSLGKHGHAVGLPIIIPDLCALHCCVIAARQRERE